MKFFNLDCHTSVIEDIKQIFDGFGHTVDSWNISSHNWVFGKNPTNVDIINSNTWKNIDANLIDQFTKKYEDILKTYDAFICAYPPVFSMIYEKFNKPIILYIPIRYEVPFSQSSLLWHGFNKFLQKNIDSNIIIPISNSLYDKKYFEHFVDRPCHYIPSLCDYTNSKWKKSNDKFLIYNKITNISLNHDKIDTLPNIRYSWQDIFSYRGIIHFPYNASTMSIFEQYTANVPLLFPSPDFLIKLYSQYPTQILSQISWHQILNLEKQSCINNSYPDPNNTNDIESVRHWISFADYYNEEWMPYITYFDSISNLFDLINIIDSEDINKKIYKHNILRKQKILDLWNNIIKEKL